MDVYQNTLIPATLQLQLRKEKHYTKSIVMKLQFIWCVQTNKQKKRKVSETVQRVARVLNAVSILCVNFLYLLLANVDVLLKSIELKWCDMISIEKSTFIHTVTITIEIIQQIYRNCLSSKWITHASVHHTTSKCVCVCSNVNFWQSTDHIEVLVIISKSFLLHNIIALLSFT